jgi:hypothetical protein
MRVYDNGQCFTVTFSELDSNHFADRWPCSMVQGDGSFSFGKATGDLVDAGGLVKSDGADWVAFARDCQAFGLDLLGRRADLPHYLP